MSDRDPLADVLYESEQGPGYRLGTASDYVQSKYRDLARVAREFIAAEVENMATPLHWDLYEYIADRIARRDNG